MGETRAMSTTARADVTLQRVGREAILHDARAGQAHVINASAARIWELCDGRTFDDLLTVFAAPYDLGPDDVRSDVERVLQGFRDLGLLEPDAGP
ncbi:MAG: HPr-rel-A system PqqD family peptide chaperone [Candidatus Limnocylindrales bacterium]